MMRARRARSVAAPEATVVCPGCGARHDARARFCERCNLPVVREAPPPGEHVSDRQRHLRKIKPQLADGPLVSVAYARNLAEAELIQGLLLEQGVPSLLRRSAGFDVPDFLAAGPRDVLVPLAGVDVARAALLQAEIAPSEQRVAPPVSAPRLLAGMVVALAAGALILWLVSLALH